VIIVYHVYIMNMEYLIFTRATLC